MGSGHQILLMIFMIIIVVFLTISLQGSTHILIFTDGSSLGSKAHGLQELHLMEDSNNGVPERVQKVSGEDESEKKEALILQKFRALLGLQRFKAKRTPRDDSQSLSPSPSPSVPYEPETPASAPLQRNIHSHSHPSQPRTRPGPPHHKIQKQETDSGRVRRILVPVLLSAGAAFVACVLGFMCACGKFRKLRKKSAGTMSVHSKKSKAKCKSKYTKSQSSTRNVSLNPTLDLFYLNSSGVDLEQQGSCLNQTSEAIKASPDHERKESNQEVLMKSESDNASSSSTREIMSFHEDAGSVRYESDGGDSLSCDKIVPLECHSSEDESFHSFGDSHSSNLRLSNASAASLSDAAENCPRSLPSSTNLAMLQAKPDNVSTLAPLSPDKSEVVNSTMSGSLDCDQKFIPAPPTPPPPPPPPPPSKRVSLSHSSSCSSRITSKASSPASLPNLSSPKFLDSSSGSKQGLLGDLPGSSIPPPPCPPPFLKGKGNSFKGPPPSPCQLPQYTPMGKDGAPLPKLKPLHWDKVRAAPDRSMVWDKLRSSSFELDEEMMESLFGYNIQSSMKNDETKSKSPSPSKHVLEPKRLQNITILSKALSATAEQVCNALMKGEGLCLQQLEALVKMVPTKEEEAKLSGYKGDINELGSAEKFVKAMLSIPFAFLRVEAMLYKETFEDEVFHLRNSFSMLEEACKELRSSRLFLKLLEAVLKTGNRMNVGTIRGGAQAFKLDALLKLADVKGTDGKTTLLHFVVQEIIRSEGIRVSDSIMGKINKRSRSKTVEEREEDYRRMGLDLVSGLTTELYNVKKTATIDLDVLASSVSNLSDGMAKLQNLVHQDLSTNPTSGSFIHTMNSFMNYAEKNLKELQEDEDRVLLHVREITEYFHGEVGKDEVNPLRIFVIVRDFLGMLDHVCKELRSLKVPSSPSPLAPFR